jgi:ribonuclease VapC
VILDASAILAILFGEPERADLLDKMDRAPVIGVGAPTLVETALVMTSRRGETGRDAVARFVERLDVAVVAFDHVHWVAAADAWALFGKGRHRARLNFGDCLAYATARVAGRPLLCKGDDFAQTDIELA